MSICCMSACFVCLSVCLSVYLSGDILYGYEARHSISQGKWLTLLNSSLLIHSVVLQVVLYKGVSPDDVKSADVSISAGVRRVQVVVVFRFLNRVKVKNNMVSFLCVCLCLLPLC